MAVTRVLGHHKVLLVFFMYDEFLSAAEYIHLVLPFLDLWFTSKFGKKKGQQSCSGLLTCDNNRGKEKRHLNDRNDDNNNDN